MDELKMMTMAEITKLYPPPAPASRKPTDEELRAAGIVDAELSTVVVKRHRVSDDELRAASIDPKVNR